jgi:hypothetical protein
MLFEKYFQQSPPRLSPILGVKEQWKLQARLLLHWPIGYEFHVLITSAVNRSQGVIRSFI